MRYLPQPQKPIRRFPRQIGKLAVVGLLGTLPLISTPALAQDISISGTARLVWGDPATGPPLRRWYLTDAAGRTYELDVAGLSESQLQSLAGRGTTVSGDLSTRAGAADGATPMLNVRAVAFLDASAAAAAEAVSGPQPWANLLCRFPDVPATQRPPSYFDDLMGASYPRLDHYWREISYDRIDISGSGAYGWYELPRPKSGYQAGTDANGNPIPDLHALAQDCAGAAEEEVDFTRFVGINVMLNDAIGCCAWGGSASLELSGRVMTFRMTWIPPWGFQSLTVVAHEMGHGFGLMHSSGPYESTYDSEWDVMSGGGYCRNRHPDFGCVPVHAIAHHKDLLGWIPSTRRFQPAPGTVTSLRLEPLDRPATDGYTVAVIPIDEESFYTVEARHLEGYDAELPAAGVLIHRVTAEGRARVVDWDADGDPNDEGAIWSTGEVFVDHEARLALVIDGESATGWDVTLHYGVDLPAHTLDVVVDGGGRGSITSDPAGVACRSPADAAGPGECRATFALGSRVWLTATPYESDGQSDTFAGWGGPCADSGPSCLLFVDGDMTVTARFDGEPPAIALMTATPISFNAMVGMVDPPAARVEIDNAGGSPITDLALGSPAPAEAAGWLTATLDRRSTPAAVLLEVNAASLTPGVYTASLPIQSQQAANSPHSIDIVINVAAAVSADELVRALAGDTRLTPQAITYLDARGNDNGSFDLGDFLAWLDATQGRPAALVTDGDGEGDR